MWDVCTVDMVYIKFQQHPESGKNTQKEGQTKKEGEKKHKEEIGTKGKKKTQRKLRKGNGKQKKSTKKV